MDIGALIPPKYVGLAVTILAVIKILDEIVRLILSEIRRLSATRVVIAHRLSTVLNADRIYVLEGGQLVETGTYAELLQHEGVFSALARRQIA